MRLILALIGSALIAAGFDLSFKVALGIFCLTWAVTPFNPVFMRYVVRAAKVATPDESAVLEPPNKNDGPTGP